MSLICQLQIIFLRLVLPVVDLELLYPQAHDPLGEAKLCCWITFPAYIRW